MQRLYSDRLLEMNAIAGLFSPYIYGIATDSDQG